MLEYLLELSNFIPGFYSSISILVLLITLEGLKIYSKKLELVRKTPDVECIIDSGYMILLLDDPEREIYLDSVLPLNGNIERLFKQEKKQLYKTYWKLRKMNQKRGLNND